jgi:hypothetical protein
MPMRFAKARLVTAVLVLFAWIGYIAYQALAYGRFPVVSHAQLLVSKLDVIADVMVDDSGQPLPNVRIVEVHWPLTRKDLEGQELQVINVGDPHVKGFQGSGRYILPLVPAGDGKYEIAPLPRSPGFGSAELFIYPDTPLAREQLNAAPKPPVGQPKATAGK